MKSVVEIFEKAFETKQRREWDKVYVAVDIHETILKPTWSEQRSNEYYEYALECLRILSEMKDVYLIQWSSSSIENNRQYFTEFMKDGVIFESINCNEEVGSTDYADFDSKFYMNVILDDKAGFEPEKDWKELLHYLVELNIS